jgi:signal transduction histidine kinase
MSPANQPGRRYAIAFRAKLLGAMMLVVSALTSLGLFLAQRNVAANARRDLQQNFQAEISLLHNLQELRHAALAERCRILAEKPRIHASLEDNALDLLYPSAKDELHDLMETGQPATERAAGSLHATFYRFLDDTGAVLAPPDPKDVGVLNGEAEAQLSFKKLPDRQQVGYLARAPAQSKETLDEVIAVPIFSTDTGEVISALVVGFKPFEFESKGDAVGIKSGIWSNGRLDLPLPPNESRAVLSAKIARAVSGTRHVRNNFVITTNGEEQLLFYKLLNPDSIFPPAYEICVYPLANWIARLHRLRWQIGSAGVLLLFGGFLATHLVTRRVSAPVEKLAIDSAEDRAGRKQAEAALALTSKELERSARYSADASHQLKSPVTVLRAGLETLLTREDFEPGVYEELSALLHQTHRLTGVIDDLLLLSRMDAGHLQIKAETVDLSHLVEEWLEDLRALPDAPDVTIEKKIPAHLYVAGERQYTSLIVQNLLENARKYNRTSGCIRVTARAQNGEVRLNIGNTGRPIPAAAQQHIFERFRHLGSGPTASGHGLGLNLARDLARLHGGDLRLLRSEDDWTEFEVRFRAAERPLKE